MGDEEATAVAVRLSRLQQADLCNLETAVMCKLSEIQGFRRAALLDRNLIARVRKDGRNFLQLTPWGVVVVAEIRALAAHHSGGAKAGLKQAVAIHRASQPASLPMKG